MAVQHWMDFAGKAYLRWQGFRAYKIRSNHGNCPASVT